LFDGVYFAIELIEATINQKCCQQPAKKTSGMQTIQDAQRALQSGATSARALTERCLAAVKSEGGEGPRTFLKVNEAAALARADEIDALRRRGAELPPFAGIPISIKDLFDVQGEVTTAGSVVLKNAAPASADAAAVARLRAAGFIMIGRTNMTEFAYSGVGLNPHYGTPKNPYERSRGRIPGGSSSGAAISVTDGMAFAGLGTDTGGSCRIPAALTGLVGWKPTAERVSCEGVLPLSPSLDSVGWLARSVSCCAILDAVVAGNGSLAEPARASLRGRRFAVPQTLVFDDIEPEVEKAFERALTRLSQEGSNIVPIAFKELGELAGVNAKGGFAAAESYAWHRGSIETRGKQYDPRVRARILRGAEQNDADYRELVEARRRLIDSVSLWIKDFDAILLPATPIIAPTFNEVVAEHNFTRLNLFLLRNTTIANFFDLCAISLPCHAHGEAPVGLMMMTAHGNDQRLFALAAAVEHILAYKHFVNSP
jgi:aspartyl-tRNA(Asn)/glutamyl-tRNA(Gln) amidotransferase subunit A